MPPDIQDPIISGYQPLYCTRRGEVVESIHFGAVAVVQSNGELIAWAGNPRLRTYLRSSAKPFQAIPLVEMGGMEYFGMSARELAVTCASHSGTDRHLRNIAGLQKKIGISDVDLLCCTHQPFDQGSREKLKDQGLRPSQNHHNCSGKHTGMLAQAVMLNASRDSYTEIEHPVQQGILRTFSEMCGLDSNQIRIGRDGCSVPTFAVPLYHAAWAWARLVDPEQLPSQRAAACRAITEAITHHPYQVAGPGRLDTRLMKAFQGKLISKAGAEAYQALGIFPDAIAPGSPALGIVLKISDGDHGKRARRAVSLEVLKQMGILSTDELEQVTDLGPAQVFRNQCGIITGTANPCFQLQYS